MSIGTVDRTERYLLIGILIGVVSSLLPSLPETRQIFRNGDRGEVNSVTYAYLIVITAIIVALLM